MATTEANYDKILLAVAALLALGGAGYIYTLSGSFSQKLAVPKGANRNDFPDTEGAKTGLIAAKQNLDTTFDWVSPVKNGKPVPLNVSIPVVLKDGVLYDMFTENPPLRPPMTNKFLRENELDFLSPNVAELDPDHDYFNNLEEFNKQTNPKDPKSLPPITDKLYFVGRKQHDYILTMQSPEAPWLIKLNKPDAAPPPPPAPPPGNASDDAKAAPAPPPPRAAPAASAFVQPQFPFDFGCEKNAPPRFTATGFTPKKDGNKDLSELAVTDKSTGAKFVLTYKVPYNLAEFEAELEYRIGDTQVFTVKKGGTFRIGGIAATYILLDVTDESATIAPVGADGKPGTPFVSGKRP